MKKFIVMMVAILATMSMSAQNQSNYYGSSKFTDNWSVTLQGGIITPTSDVMKHVSPIIVVGADKYITPWLGVGVEGRTAIAAPSGMYNPHTAFDAVNVSLYGELNVINMFTHNPHAFDVVVYFGPGWGHSTCSHTGAKYNYLTLRPGMKLGYKINDAIAVNVNPSMVWGDIDNGKLIKQHSHLELTAGLTYYFKTSNRTRSFKAPVLYDYEGMQKLSEELATMKNRKPQVKVVERVKNVYTSASTKVYFAQNSAQLSNDAKALLDKIPVGSKVTVGASASPEGTSKRNTELINDRAEAVKNYLESRGVTVVSVDPVESARQATVVIQ